MANDVVLSASMRSNLLSLQNTQRSIDVTQLRLATGRKVNSALDNPQSFFTSQSLSNRASDLTRLLDGIGQSIRTIEEADKGITALTSLVEQAQSIASSARDELAASDGEARALGNVDLSAVTNLVGFGTIGATDEFNVATTDANGVRINELIAIDAGDTAYTIAAKITDQFADNRAGEITARITDEGFLEIASTTGRAFRITDSTNVANQVTLAGFAALGLDRYFEAETRGANTVVGTTIIAGNELRTRSMYESTGNLADAGDFLSTGAPAAGYTDESGNVILTPLSAADTFTFVINNSGVTTSGAITLAAATTWQDVVDQINGTAAVNQLIEAEFDNLTGQFVIRSLSDTVENIEIQLDTAAAETYNLGWGDPSGALDPITTAAPTAETVFSFNNSTATLDRLADDYNTLREQIDDLVQDAQYRGVNLLRGDDLVTFFNEDNSSSLTTQGGLFTADGLGLTVASFRSSAAIELTASQARDALETVRGFGSTLANNLSIIQTRRTFTEETIVTLKAGSADLVNADDNEEGANLLALQTRQQLGVTSLSLASQSQQSVLRLF